MREMSFYSKFVIGLFLLFFSYSCSLCGPVNSTDVDTSEIWASFTVAHEKDTRITAWVLLKANGSGGNVIEMDGGEKLTCNGVTLRFDSPYYYTRFPVPAANDTYTFVFHRVGDRADVSTEVIVPGSPDPVTTNPANNYNEWDPLDVYWDTAESATGDLIDLTISGTDINTYSEDDLVDDGSHTVTDIISIDNAEVSPISVSIIRYHIGSVNIDYQGGYTMGERWAQSYTINNFQPRLTLEIIIDPDESGEVTSVGNISGTTSSGTYRKYEMNETITLVAVTAPGWIFDYWSGDISGSNNPYVISSITSNMSITAHFEYH